MRLKLKRSKEILILLLLGLSRLFLINPTPAIFDAPEYAQLSQRSFVEAVTLGHKPNRPGFMAILWVSNKAAKMFGISNPYLTGGVLSTLAFLIIFPIFYFWLQLFLPPSLAFKSAIFSFFFPIVSFLSTSLAPESVALVFLVSAIFFVSLYLKKGRECFAFLSSLFLALTIFTNSPYLVWLPAFFLPVFLGFGKKVKSDKSEGKNAETKNLTYVFGAGLSLSIFAYLAIFLLQLKRSVPVQLFLPASSVPFVDWYNFPIGTLRWIRNLAISTLRDYTPILSLAAAITLVRMMRKNPKQLIIVGLLLGLPFVISGIFLSVDFAGRRNLPAALIVSTLAAQSVRKKSVFILLVSYLMLTVLPILIQASFFSNNQPAHLWQQMQKQLNPGGLYITSHYNRQISLYQGDIFPINEPSLSMEKLVEKIEKTLYQKKVVYLDSQAVFDPYMYYGGPTLHILSLGQFGKSEARELFTRYQTKLARVEDVKKRIYVYQLLPVSQISSEAALSDISQYVDLVGGASPAQSILVYSTRFYDRILPQRQDYYDPVTWLWVLLTGRQEPIAWTYADARGVYSLPVLDTYRPDEIIVHKL